MFLLFVALSAAFSADLSVSSILPGETAVFELQDVPPGQLAYFYATTSSTGMGRCAALAPSVCHELDDDVLIGSVVADPDGTARLEVVTPRIPSGRPLFFQAGWVDPIAGIGEASLVVERIADTIADACGDGLVDILAGEICDDGNTDDDDGCDSTCIPAELGPATPGPDEVADDNPLNANIQRGDCPDNHVAVGLDALTGQIVDSAAASCAPLVDGVPTSTLVEADSVGGSGGSSRDATECPDGVLVGLRVSTMVGTGSLDTIDMVTGLCKPWAEVLMGSDNTGITSETSPVHGWPWGLSGYDQGIPSEVFCPDGSVMVGLSGQNTTRGYLGSLRPICATTL